MAGEVANGITKPFRIGIFWETESDTFPPGKGKEILSNLVSELLEIEKTMEVALFVRPEDQDVTAELKNRSSGRLGSVLFLDRSGCPQSRNTILRKVGRRLAAVAETKEIIANLTRRGRSRISTDIRRVLRGARSKSRKSPVAGFLPMVLGVCLAFSIILVYWFIYSVMQLGTAVLRSLFFPAPFFLKIDALRRSFDRLRLSLDPLILAKETDCDVWLVPSLTFPYSLKNLRAATVVMLPQTLLNGPISQELAGLSIETANGIPSNRAAEASLCVRLTSNVPDGQLEPVLGIDPARFRQMPLVKAAGDLGPQGELHSMGRKEAAQKWLDVFREAVEIARWRATFDEHVISPWSNPACPGWLVAVRRAVAAVRWRANLDHQLVKVWPRFETAPPSPRDPLKVFLFLPHVYYGGVLQVTRELTSELAAINRQRQRLHLTLGLLENQGSTQFLKQLDKAVVVQRMRVNPIRRAEVVRLCGSLPPWLANRPEHEFCFLSGAAEAAFQADAWFSLIDRFPLPLLPARPLGILVQDVIQRRHPEIFGMVFFRNMSAGIIPTARSADVIVTGTPQTRDDVIAAYGVDPSRVRLIPVACNPHWHFNQTQPRAVAKVREPFILNVTNYSPHKGGDVLLRAYAQLKRRLGADTPQLVMCGFGTQGFSPAYMRDDGPLYWRAIRQMVTDFGFEEGWDVAFLGEVSDEQLHYLYQHCCVVVNSARYDNGCLCLAEGAYFGRPAVSSRYPAAEFHAQRFGYSGRFFPIGDAEALAETLADAVQEPPATPEDIARARARFEDPEFSFRRYSERFYDVLVQLAEKGRLQKQTSELRKSA